jgi:hypothetical protein
MSVIVAVGVIYVKLPNDSSASYASSDVLRKTIKV